MFRDRPCGARAVDAARDGISGSIGSSASTLPRALFFLGAFIAVSGGDGRAGREQADLLARCTAAGAGSALDTDSCEVALQTVAARLASLKGETASGQHAADALGAVRERLLSGRRLEIPSVQRHHLAAAAPRVFEVTHDWKHRPVSTNVSRHLRHVAAVLPDTKVSFFAFLHLRDSGGDTGGAAPRAILVALDSNSRLWVFSQAGEPLVQQMDLGHAVGRAVTQLAVSQTSKRRVIVSVDEACSVKFHGVSVRKQREDGQQALWMRLYHRLFDRDGSSTKWLLHASVNASSSFEASISALGFCVGGRTITSLLVMESGTTGPRIIIGDALGSISVVTSDGRLLGRLRVSLHDPDGPGKGERNAPEAVVGLQLRQDQTVLFHTARSFGFFSPERLELLGAPCPGAGWSAPAAGVLADPGGFTPGGVLLSLADGENVVYSSRCEPVAKLPRLRGVPFRLHALQGLLAALPTPPPSPAASASAAPRRVEDAEWPELYVFDTKALQKLVGEAPPRSIAAQVPLPPGRYDHSELFVLPEGASLERDRSEAYLALRRANTPGLLLQYLSLRHRDAGERAQQRWTRSLTVVFGLFFGFAALSLYGIWKLMKWLEAPTDKKGNGREANALDDVDPAADVVDAADADEDARAAD
eukprot:TRINITY_DN10717_c0_g1_i1.p1 TRINITY_DN10717_c0_g1~~TRINITY_DN10717_c0_g1_i1.p1  ORF type:complete len:646 (-),score=154.27 TRINITY_DN10717_c0_g1_i1:136-2073(-)